MKQQDLGVLDGRVLLFGGPYSNLQATEAVLAEAEARGIDADHMICTGDVVAYCAAPGDTVAAIRQSGCAVVAGNCEKQLAAYADNCGCGFEAGTTCDLLSAGWYAHAATSVGDEDRAWMGALPDMIRFTHHGRGFAVIHGGVTDVSRFIWSCSDAAVFDEEIAKIKTLLPDLSAVVAGHSGLPFQRQIGDVLWVNAGVIGMPPHDGTSETRFAILDQGQVTIHRLAYDTKAAHADMVAVGLVQGYDKALLSGVWPSEQVLPAALRRDQSLAKG